MAPVVVTDATLEAMEKYGGSFVQALAELYRRADIGNRATLIGAFRETFKKYNNITRPEADRP
jgi:hypothetical protein